MDPCDRRSRTRTSLRPNKYILRVVQPREKLEIEQPRQDTGRGGGLSDRSTRPFLRSIYVQQRCGFAMKRRALAGNNGPRKRTKLTRIVSITNPIRFYHLWKTRTLRVYGASRRKRGGSRAVSKNSRNALRDFDLVCAYKWQGFVVFFCPSGRFTVRNYRKRNP
ncbi:uncharacterized protein LOC113464597 [Ceratina calcarata]|uniref:Uncharacterized protein LOC113464597 n=1 Tax=Ceratina calcarata TaxID=156304 RepID=A0AAJ7WC54_9HYME|nr:uncharacterized protein LOC113464597 [Ceratina calcarata]